MQLNGNPKAFIRSEAADFINLYRLLGERAEIFLPKHILDNLRNFVKLCYEEPTDPAKQQAEINKYILEFKEAIPGYVDVALMLYPTEESKAYQYSAKKLVFKNRLTSFIDNESLNAETKKYATNILNSHDFSIGTPPVTADLIEYLSRILLGDVMRDLRKFRDVIGITDNIDEAHWNYFMDTLEQMVIQSTHYTTKPEREDFLHRTEWAVNFKGLNGLIRTVVAGNADTAVKLIKGEVFSSESVVVLDNVVADELYEMMQQDSASIFVLKVKHMRKNPFAGPRWFPLMTRLVVVDDSLESRSSNTCLVFALHNGIINTLNKAQTKKMGAAANTQLNLRLILENINSEFLDNFRARLENKIREYDSELYGLKMEQLGEVDNLDKNIALYKFDEFTRQILKDKYSLEKLRDFILFIENVKDPQKLQSQNAELIAEFESRMKAYFYANNPQLSIATVVEGGGRSQIKVYGEYLLQRELKVINKTVADRCQIILDVIPNNYKRTLHNHYHKNFGVNLFLEKYQQYLAKVENDADNKGRFKNFLIDLGIYDDYIIRPEEEQNVVKEFLSGLGNLDRTSIADDVQMIVRDLLFNKESKPKPYILYNKELAWEYNDLFPDSSFNINPFDITLENTEDGHIDFERLLGKLQRIKISLALFDETGNLWDRFCANTTIVLNDPSNPTGYSDFNRDTLLSLIKFLSTSKITLLLDEAYTDSVKIEDENEPKWQTISRYVFNNINSIPNISIVSSVSTTKNLGATGERLGCLVSTPEKKDVIEFARLQNGVNKGNNNSLVFLCNILEAAQSAKKIKDKMQTMLAQDASRYKIKEYILSFVKEQVLQKEKEIQDLYENKQWKKIARFEGSPLFIFLLDELVELDKLDLLQLPDDFKYEGKPYFSYYSSYLLKALNRFRVNKIFRGESIKRLKLAKEIAHKLLDKHPTIDVLESDGSYLFNILLKEFTSYTDLELFTKKLAETRGISALPYKAGVVRFSLGGYMDGTDAAYDVFGKELDNALKIFLKYWSVFQEARLSSANKEVDSSEILERVFASHSETDFMNKVLEDYAATKAFVKVTTKNTKINDIRTLYHASPEVSGISINTIGTSKNSVIEFQGNIGDCRDVNEFIRSRAFTKVYENLLSQIYKKIPYLKSLDFNTVASKYSKTILLKYINNKKSFHPNHYVLDDPEELNIMREILVEMENLLFSDSKFKLLALPASKDIAADKARLEGVNRILRKFIEEILLHFNLPFAKNSKEPSRKEIIEATREKFEELIGVKVEEINLQIYTNEFFNTLRGKKEFKESSVSERSFGAILNLISTRILNADLPVTTKILSLYLMKNDDSFYKMIISKLQYFDKQIAEAEGLELQMITENLLAKMASDEFGDILNYILRKRDIKVSEEQLHLVTQKVVLFFIELINRTRGTNFYEKYTHNLISIVESEFKRQNSSINEMIQHGITIHKNFEMKNKVLETWNNGELKWINDVMRKCGVVGSEQSVQTHTRSATDAKKREYPFHKVDRVSTKLKPFQQQVDAEGNVTVLSDGTVDARSFIQSLDVKPSSAFFSRRLASFIANMDTEDYRCKIINHGLVKELYIIQKSYIKYLTDNFRILQYQDVTLKDIQGFVPDTICVYGAPEKVVSFPQISYFDLKGPYGNIKTIVTPLKKEVDYFGDIKKPRLQMINEKIKEMGGVPKHGSLFAVEEEDGSVTVIEINGDSGVGKSEMIAALILKWLRQNLPGVRSVKLIAGDMYHVFRDTEGNMYGIGTEVGDFSRVTDFDPDYIKYYRYLFESSSDSNVEDLNSRANVSGLCDIQMPYKIDIMLTASNYSKDEAGVTRIDNPENFLLYIDSHGERKEKATSEDGPNFQRTLLRYSADPNIVDVLGRHGNYLDDLLDWQLEPKTKTFYLASSYKMIDKINIEVLVNKIFAGKVYKKDGKKFRITEVKFDIIKNRFRAYADIEGTEDQTSFLIDRKVFGALFDTIASTPAGQPFVAEEGQLEIRSQLVDLLKGGADGKGKGRLIQCGILSTELGKKGKEITGPQKAAEAVKRMLQEVKISNPEILRQKNAIKKVINEKYQHIFHGDLQSAEVWRYNFYLSQLEQMRKAEFVRLDNPNVKVDLSSLKGFVPKNKNEEFSPLLVTPNLNIELNGFSETFEELMSLPNYPEFAEEFAVEIDKLYVAHGYSEETIINNMIVQLLLMDGYINLDDISRGKISEKVNRETIAAAKYAVVKRLKDIGKVKPNAEV